MSDSTGIMLEMLELSPTGMKLAHIRAVMDAPAEARANRPRSGRFRTHNSIRHAPTPPNQAEVVTASNMFELGQRSEMYQRSSRAHVWKPKATMNRATPMRW